MTKEEFLKELRGKITGKLSQADVEHQINYYASYIDDEVSHGRNVEDVLDELGDPQLIAKTLYEASDGGYLDSSSVTASGNSNAKTGGTGEEHAGGQYGRGYESRTGNTGTYERYAGETENTQKKAKRTALKTKAWIILIFAAIIAIIVLLFIFVIRVGVFLFTNLIPFFIVALIIIFLVVFLRRR